jgi:hypothetical protein
MMRGTETAGGNILATIMTAFYNLVTKTLQRVFVYVCTIFTYLTDLPLLKVGFGMSRVLKFELANKF